jgi:CubicO group peptidase (beta-lactamase class C family)
MAKFGLLYINGGKHNGQQIIPEAWVTESITTQVKRHSGSEGYGYQFWCGRDSILGKDVKIALGIGYGGQRIYLLPAIDLVIVVTAGNYNEHSDLSDEVVGKFIRPAIKNN